MNDKLPIGINLLNNSYLVKRNSNLHLIRRGQEVLIIEKESASFLVLSGPRLAFFNSLQKPATVAQLNEGPPLHMDMREKESLLRDLYERNMISINGSYCHNPKLLWQPLPNNPGFLCFHLTHACNFRCKYCYARAEDDHGQFKKMPRETSFRAVEKMITDIPKESLLIDFHGGEPFVAFDDMVEIMEHAHKFNEETGSKKKLSFICQTNGSLATVERAKILQKLNGNFGFSLDGPRHIHDKNRVYGDGSGTFDDIMANYQALTKAGFNVGTLAVVHDPADYLEVLKFFIFELRKTNIRINYSAYIGRATEELEFPHGRAETFARHYLEMVDFVIAYVLEHKKNLYIKDLDSQINNIFFKNRPFMCFRSPCGCGNSILGFGADGGIFACEEAVGVEAFRLGSVFDDTNLKDILDNSPVLKNISGRTVDNIPKCRECPFKHFCGGRCTTKSFARYGNFRREDPMCRFYQIVYPELIWKFHDNEEALRYLNSDMTQRFKHLDEINCQKEKISQNCRNC